MSGAVPDRIRIRAASARVRCPYCREDIAPRAPRVSCHYCQAYQHPACWQAHGSRCTNCSQREEGHAPPASAPLAEPAQRWVVACWAALTLLWVVFTLAQGRGH